MMDLLARSNFNDTNNKEIFFPRFIAKDFPSMSLASWEEVHNKVMPNENSIRSVIQNR